MVHRNFERTEELVKNLLEMNARIGQLEEMLYEDTRDILGPATNLLSIHYQVGQLENFRNETMNQAKNSSPESKATLAKWFDRLNKIIMVFDAYILDLAQNILPLVRAHREDVVIKLIKIAEVEGKADERVSETIKSQRHLVDDEWPNIVCWYLACYAREERLCSKVQEHGSKDSGHQKLPPQNHPMHQRFDSRKVQRRIRKGSAEPNRIPRKPRLDVSRYYSR